MTKKIPSHQDGCIAKVMLDNPKKLNVIDLEMWTALGNTMASLSKNTELR